MSSTGTIPTERIRAHGHGIIRAVERFFDIQQIDRLADIASLLSKTDGMIWTIGNGGSAANASHLTTHLVDSKLRSACLMDHVSLLTARSNDINYDTALEDACSDVIRPGDVLVAFSCSGRSLNVVNALRYARTRGAKGVGFFGFADDGQWWTELDAYIGVDSHNYGVIEDVHSMLIHMLKELLSP